MKFDAEKREQLAQATDLMKTLSHPLRLAILCCLIEQVELSAGAIAEMTSHLASQSQVSQYLGYMRAQGLISARQEAQMIYYRLNSDIAYDVISTLYHYYCAE